MLNKKDLIELISITKQHIDLPEAVLEKDYFVTQVIHALSDLENEYFSLIFCGGTCLAKAHKVVSRMSEDIDFKIQIKKIDIIIFSKTCLMKKLKEFRASISSKLILFGLVIEKNIVSNEGRYSRLEISYPSIFGVNLGLRPYILLEFTLSNIYLSVESLSVRTLIEDTLKNKIIFTSSLINCVSVEETAIEKWVSLTRRIMAIERKYQSDDSTLVRHIYDLNSIKKANKINDKFFNLAKTIVTYDAKKFKNQHTEYFDDSANEIKQSIILMKNKPLWKERYQEFIETMVYDHTDTLEYDKAVDVLEDMSEKILDFL